MANDESRDLRALLARDLCRITVVARSRPWRRSVIDSPDEAEARWIHYRLTRDRGDIVFVLDPRDEPQLRRRWDGGIGWFLDGLVVRAADLRVSPLQRQRPQAGARVAFIQTTDVLDPGAVFHVLVDGAAWTTAVYVVDRKGGVLVDDVCAGCSGVLRWSVDPTPAPVMPGS
jgi:hypothetical protein